MSFSLFCHRLFNCSEWRFHFSLLIQNFGKSWFFKSPAKNQRKKNFWKKNFLEKKFFRPEKFFFQKIFFPVDFSLWFFAGSLKNQLFPNDFWQNVPIYSKIKKNTLLHYFDRFHTLLGKITETFRTVFPYYLGSKSDSRNLFHFSGLRPSKWKNVSWITFWTSITGKKCSQSFRNFSEKWKTTK